MSDLGIDLVLFSVQQLFKRMCDQFDKMRKRNVYLQQYKTASSLGEQEVLNEMDESRCVLKRRSPLKIYPLILMFSIFFIYRAVVQELINEYEACEDANYLNWSPAEPSR